MFTAAFPQQPLRCGSHPSVQGWMNEYTECSTPYNEVVLSLEKEGNANTCVKTSC
jgi:hypothetical protein